VCYLEGKKTKIVIFMRHGESDWNYIFNKNKLLLLPRLVMGFIREACYFMFNERSVFIDSCLDDEGVHQANELKKFLWPSNITRVPGKSGVKDTLIQALKGEEGAISSVLVCSNLRRAIETGCIALWPRLSKKKPQDKTQERIQLHSALQEVTRNVDTNSLLTAKGQYPDSSVVEKSCPGFDSRKYLDVNSNSIVNKTISRRAHHSLEEFAGWCFERDEDIIVVSAGHSIWFRRFFAAFLPDKQDENHYAKKQKMKNCSVVAFNLTKGVRPGSAEEGYRIEKESITSLYLGFEKHSEETPNQLQLPIKKDDSANGEQASKSWFGFGWGKK